MERTLYTVIRPNRDDASMAAIFVMGQGEFEAGDIRDLLTTEPYNLAYNYGFDYGGVEIDLYDLYPLLRGQNET